MLRLRWRGKDSVAAKIACKLFKIFPNSFLSILSATFSSYSSILKYFSKIQRRPHSFNIFILLKESLK